MEYGKCYLCGNSSEEVALLVCEVKGEEKKVCVRCLPMLIHG
jgi:hypothetical protein